MHKHILLIVCSMLLLAACGDRTETPAVSNDQSAAQPAAQPKENPKADAQPAAKEADDHAGHDHAGDDHAGHDHAGDDHAGHDHAKQADATCTCSVGTAGGTTWCDVCSQGYINGTASMDKAAVLAELAKAAPE
jgi:hypothetical protein